jgi:hypothetical protein
MPESICMVLSSGQRRTLKKEIEIRCAALRKIIFFVIAKNILHFTLRLSLQAQNLR